MAQPNEKDKSPERHMKDIRYMDYLTKKSKPTHKDGQAKENNTLKNYRANSK